MCTSPSTKDGNTFACRRCNQCVAARRSDWVSRAMAEKTLHQYTLAITLTYGDETQHQRDGAAMFQYEDIRLLLARIRRHIKYHTGESESIRYLCAGEQGDRKRRCHWHMVVFTNTDLTTIGEWLAPWGVVTKQSEIISGNRPMRRRWSLWPHGFVVVQEPDVSGIKYAISYALKDQFATDKSMGTSRQSTSENLATGMFRMSKKPPIGWPYAQQYIDRLGEANSIPPKLTIPIPDYKYYWFPRGTVRRLLLEGIRDANQKIIERTGRNAAQWTTLLHNCADNESDMEVLLDEPEDENEESAETAIRKRAAETHHEQKRRETIRRCGSTAPCTACLRSLSEQQLQAAGVELFEIESGQSGYRYAGEATNESLRKAQRDASRKGINPFCGLAGTSYTAKAFGDTKNQPQQK